MHPHNTFVSFDHFIFLIFCVQEVIGEVMVEAPLLKEIVDHDSVPDRVTAKKQNEELDRIATTVPKVHLML